MNELARKCDVTLKKQVKESNEDGDMVKVDGKFDLVHPQFHNKIVTSY